ncbi:hypothetical protein [Roseobacter sp. GAI101]|nr:hypothetical protein [Roseobacter sp. GAI101]EEB83778.1 hypothetical protein RGAI101_927 [Roseobacter sp. GAI101]
MKAFLGAVLALIVICVGANLALTNAGFSSADMTSDSNVRLGD